MSLALGDISVKILLCGVSAIFQSMFSGAFMVSWLIFKSFIHLEFIFVCGVSWWSSSIFLHVAVQISKHHLWKRLFLLHFMLLPPWSHINWSYRFEFISGLSILFHWSMSLFLCQYQAVLITMPCNTVWYQVLWSLLLCSFSKLLQLFGVVYGSI